MQGFIKINLYPRPQRSASTNRQPPISAQSNPTLTPKSKPALQGEQYGVSRYRPPQLSSLPSFDFAALLGNRLEEILELSGLPYRVEICFVLYLLAQFFGGPGNLS